MTAQAAVRRDYVTVGHGQIHYREAGQRDNPEILLLHQSPSSSAMYVPMMERLADGFHLLAPDTPGFGNSDPVAGSLDGLEISDYAAAIRQFLSALEVVSCHVFGHHTGAAVAVQLEHDFPGTALSMVLSGPTLLTPEQQRTLPERASPVPLAADGAHLQAMWQRIRDKDPDSSLELVQREVQSAFCCGDSYLASYRAVCRQDFAGQLGAIRCPVLVFAGDEDPLYGAVEPTLARLRRGQGVALPGGERTYLCERQADSVTELVRGFFMTGVN